MRRNQYPEAAVSQEFSMQGVPSMIKTQALAINLDPTSEPAAPGLGGFAATEEEVLAVTCPEQQADSLAFQKAEFEKYRKRERKEMEEHELKAREAIMSDFLEVADNLERAIVSWKEGDKTNVQSIQDGVELVLRLFRSKLERYSVTVLDSKGKTFDPYVHHAVSQLPSAGVMPGTVLQEVQKGYWMGERLLRPASVVVASSPVTPGEASASEEEQGPVGQSSSEWTGFRRDRK
jgi:molecular chaperone GrpE